MLVGDWGFDCDCVCIMMESNVSGFIRDLWFYESEINFSDLKEKQIGKRKWKWGRDLGIFCYFKDIDYNGVSK